MTFTGSNLNWIIAVALTGLISLNSGCSKEKIKNYDVLIEFKHKQNFPIDYKVRRNDVDMPSNVRNGYYFKGQTGDKIWLTGNTKCVLIGGVSTCYELTAEITLNMDVVKTYSCQCTNVNGTFTIP